MSYLLCLCPVPIPLLPVPASPLQASNYLLHNNGPSTRQIYFPWGKEEILRIINLLQWVFRCCCFCSLHLWLLPWASHWPCHTSGHNFPRWATNHKTSFVSCEVQADTWSMFSSRVSPICALGWLLTLRQNSMSLPSLLLPPGTRWLNLFPTEFQIGHKPKEFEQEDIGLPRCTTWWSLAAALPWMASPQTFGTVEEGAAYKA